METSQSFVARGLSREAIEAEGGTVTAVIGPIVAGVLSGAAVILLAPRAELIEAPQPLHPLLDVSRVWSHADQLDQGRDLPARFRGRGALIAAYDSGLDLFHPDLRGLDGPSRVVALWDQTKSGAPPSGHLAGTECSKAALQADACPSPDPIGHGTHVLSIAAGNAPKYRGIAPEAGVILARSDNYELLVETLAWFGDVARQSSSPMVVNLSIGGHVGPHDGTSLEAQAVDAFGALVVAAAGNEGTTPVHVSAILRPEEIADVALRFPANLERRPQRAAVEIWGESQHPPSAEVLLMKSGGMVLATTSTIGAGSPGRTVDLAAGGASIGRAQLDAETAPSPFNGKTHVALSFELPGWQDPPVGPGFIVVRVRGEGRVDLWVDSPANQFAPVAFDKDGVLAIRTEIAADTASSVSDLATAASAIAVAAYASRRDIPSEQGRLVTGGIVGALAPFSSHGPTLAPARTGAKPDIAAPGYVVIAAQSRDSPRSDPRLVTALYRAAAGTSASAPHVAGTAALILAAKPAMSKVDLKRYILRSATRSSEVDPARDARWGSGQLDAARALESALGISEGCHCGSVEAPARREKSLLGMALLWSWLMGARTRVRLRRR